MVGAGALVLRPASSVAPSSRARFSPRGRAAMWFTKATASRSMARAATGHRSRSTIATATWLATAASPCRSAQAIVTKPAQLIAPFRRRADLTPGGAPASPGFVYSARINSVAILLLHVLEHRGRRPAIDLEPIGFLIAA